MGSLRDLVAFIQNLSKDENLQRCPTQQLQVGVDGHSAWPGRDQLVFMYIRLRTELTQADLASQLDGCQFGPKIIELNKFYYIM